MANDSVGGASSSLYNDLESICFNLRLLLTEQELESLRTDPAGLLERAPATICLLGRASSATEGSQRSVMHIVGHKAPLLATLRKVCDCLASSHQRLLPGLASVTLELTRLNRFSVMANRERIQAMEQQFKIRLVIEESECGFVVTVSGSPSAIEKWMSNVGLVMLWGNRLTFLPTNEEEDAKNLGYMTSNLRATARLAFMN